MAKWLVHVEETEMTEETKEIKKMKMLAIRKMVRDHITGKEKGNVPYLAKLELNKEDNARMIIALQDMVDDERNRKARAQEHIVSLIHVKNQLMSKCIEISNAAMESTMRLNGATVRIQKQHDEISKLTAELIDKDRQIQVLLELLFQDRNPPMQEKTSETFSATKDHTPLSGMDPLMKELFMRGRM